MLTFNKIATFPYQDFNGHAKIILDTLASYGVPDFGSLPQKHFSSGAVYGQADYGETYRVWEDGHIKVYIHPLDTQYPGACIEAIDKAGEQLIYDLHAKFLSECARVRVREIGEREDLFFSSHHYVLRDGRIYRHETEFRKLVFYPESLISQEEFCAYLETKIVANSWEPGPYPGYLLNSAICDKWGVSGLHISEYQVVQGDQINHINVDMELTCGDRQRYGYDAIARRDSDLPSWIEEFFYQCRPVQNGDRCFNQEKYLAMIAAVCKV